MHPKEVLWAVMRMPLQSGTTSMVSEGEQGPGWPRFYDDPIGCKAAAILSKGYLTDSVQGAKFHGGALVWSTPDRTGLQRNE